MSNPLKPYRILQLPSWYLPEGGEFCRDQSLFLKRKGLEVHILANVALPWKKYKLKALTFPWHSFESMEDGLLTFRYYYRRIPKLDKANILAWSKRTMILFDEYVKIYGKPDLIHAHSCMWGGYAAYLIKQKYDIPYVITEHRGRFGLRSTLAKEGFIPVYKPFLEKGFSNASYVIPVSQQLIAKIKEFLLKEVPIEVVSNILDTDFFHYLPRERTDNFTFITVNSFSQPKGYDILLPAFDRLCNNIPNVMLVIVGDNFEDKTFQKILSGCMHRDRIVFTGWKDSRGVLSELQKADSFVLASRVEAQSIAVLEAMSTGLPVVCTEVVPEAIVTPKEGYRVPVEDVAALADAMKTMIFNRDKFDYKAISAHVNSVSGPDVVTEQLISIYEKVLYTKK